MAEKGGGGEEPSMKRSRLEQVGLILNCIKIRLMLTLFRLESRVGGVGWTTSKGMSKEPAVQWPRTKILTTSVPSVLS